MEFVKYIPVEKFFQKSIFLVAIRYLNCYITLGYSPISNFPWPHVAQHGASLLLTSDVPKWIQPYMKIQRFQTIARRDPEQREKDS